MGKGRSLLTTATLTSLLAVTPAIAQHPRDVHVGAGMHGGLVGGGGANFRGGGNPGGMQMGRGHIGGGVPQQFGGGGARFGGYQGMHGHAGAGLQRSGDIHQGGSLRGTPRGSLEQFGGGNADAHRGGQFQQFGAVHHRGNFVGMPRSSQFHHFSGHGERFVHGLGGGQGFLHGHEFHRHVRGLGVLVLGGFAAAPAYYYYNSCYQYDEYADGWYYVCDDYEY